MGEELYEVYDPETGTVYAQRMTLEIAAVLTEALFRLWYSEPILRICISVNGQRTKEEFLARLRNGYDMTSPSIVVRCTVSRGYGRPEWGAEAGKEYYVLKILGFETER